QLPALLERLEAKLTEAGVQVHWAETADDANAIVLGIAQARNARRVIKGKSMASEEIELNHYLAERGVDCIESDMGEFIVQ
ncbi:LUD domain-containing protein, partial [Paraburkholderia sp. SIMBA_009]